MKRTFEEKLNIVSQALSGVPQRRLCIQYHLGQHYLENLIDRYIKYGEEGLYRKVQKKISSDFKVKLVRDFIEKGVTLRQICNENEIGRTAFESWVRKARFHGYDSLRTIKRRGLPHKDMGRPKNRRVTSEMRNRNHILNYKTVQRLMVQMGLKSQIRKVRHRSYKGEVGRIAPNIINRDFGASAPNRKWVTDVTQINIGSEKIYLSPILDMFNGEIISYNISRTPNLEQVYDMLDKAFARFDCLDGLILHSDQGWQYQHYGYRKRLEEHGIIQSMSRKGNCLDNAMAENFFGIMKSELLYAEKFESAEAFMKALEEYIDYYNNKRIKSRLKGKSPVVYRTLSQIG